MVVSSSCFKFWSMAIWPAKWGRKSSISQCSAFILHQWFPDHTCWVLQVKSKSFLPNFQACKFSLIQSVQSNCFFMQQHLFIFLTLVQYLVRKHHLAVIKLYSAGLLLEVKTSYRYFPPSCWTVCLAAEALSWGMAVAVSSGDLVPPVCTT